MLPLPIIASRDTRPIRFTTKKYSMVIKTPVVSLFMVLLGSTSYVHADSMSALIAQKSAQFEPAVPSAKISTRSTIQRVRSNQANQISQANTNPTSNTQANTNWYAYKQMPANNSTLHNPAPNTAYRYPEVQRQPLAISPAFLSGSYDNVDSEYLPLLTQAESQSHTAAREVISTARKMALNERTIIQGGCWDYLDAVFKRAGVTRDTVHKGAYRQGPYANSSEIEAGDWLYYINHGYNGVEHSGLFVGWVDEAAKQALMLSYAGENRREPARYRVYDLSNVYQIMRPAF
ncbi:hypothetical protein [Psychrobacter fulvigenes]|uniref:hypothetical protein n=1 Tax=Psychrobacter fulvigenes TaxID=533323 RepID=UPI001D1280A0|nr:hypothetical protein [Psychrobacter fulvigenes]